MKDRYQEDHHEFLEIYYFTPSPFEKVSPAWPVRIGKNQVKPNYHMGPRTAPVHYLIFILEGEGTFNQNGQSYPLRPNDIYCLVPNVTYEYFTDPKHPMRTIFIAFTGSKATQLLERLGFRPPFVPYLSGSLTAKAAELLQQFMDDVRHAEDTERESTDLLRLSWFLRIFDELSVTSSSDKSTDNPTSAWLQKSVEYMELHYSEGITIERVAEYAGVDRTYFTKRFRKTYGITPMRFLQNLRMNEARMLLSHTKYKISEIAQSVGYPDLFTFSKAYKKQTGISPNKFRENNWNEET